MHIRSWIVGLLGLAAALMPAGATAQSAVTILFHVRPPYSDFDAQRHVTGLLVTPVMNALAAAGLVGDWIEMPPARQTEEIKRASSPTCGLGWFKRPDREVFALFSAPIYHDRSTVVVARRDDIRFADGMSLQDSFRDGARELITKTSYSYGATIDEWIKSLQPRTETSSSDNETLLGMIAQNRADYAIMAPEEASDLFATLPALGGSLRAVRLSDAPGGELRYLMCSRSTPPDVIARINRGLAPVTAQ